MIDTMTLTLYTFIDLISKTISQDRNYSPHDRDEDVEVEKSSPKSTQHDRAGIQSFLRQDPFPEATLLCSRDTKTNQPQTRPLKSWWRSVMRKDRPHGRRGLFGAHHVLGTSQCVKCDQGPCVSHGGDKSVNDEKQGTGFTRRRRNLRRCLQNEDDVPGKSIPGRGDATCEGVGSGRPN